MLNPRVTPGASVAPLIPPILNPNPESARARNGGTQGGYGWRLQIPAGPGGVYRLAQLDDYFFFSRNRFPLSAPTSLSLRCRVSDLTPIPSPQRRWGLPGTWGFGFWNDPFTLSLGLQGTARQLPVLPNAAWFFHASPENHLSLQNHLPGNGFLAQSFSSPKIPSLLLAPGLLALPFLFSKTFSKWIRAIAGKIIGEDARQLDVDVTQWHEYRLHWSPGRVEYNLDGASIFETAVSPKGPLGLVIWIDNQFAAFTPEGKARAGTLETPATAWMEIADLSMQQFD